MSSLLGKGPLSKSKVDSLMTTLLEVQKEQKAQRILLEQLSTNLHRTVHKLLLQLLDKKAEEDTAFKELAQELGLQLQV